MTDKLLRILKNKLSSEKEVKFAYLFGSQARKDAGNLSDIDIAIYLDYDVDSFYYRLRFMETIVKAFKNEKVDIVVLNKATPLLCHQVVKNGVVVKDDRRRRLNFEIQALKKYLDTEYLRNTQLLYMRTYIKAGAYFG